MSNLLTTEQLQDYHKHLESVVRDKISNAKLDYDFPTAVLVVPLFTINAWAVTLEDIGVVAISQGMLREDSYEEVVAAICHELGHLAHYTMSANIDNYIAMPSIAREYLADDLAINLFNADTTAMINYHLKYPGFCCRNSPYIYR